MSVLSLGIQHLSVNTAEDVHDIFRALGYNVYDPEPFEGDALDELELDEREHAAVQRAYVVANLDHHTVYLYEVTDLRQANLRGLGWNALQRGTALLAVTRNYREIIFVDPRFAGKPSKSNVRVNKLKVVTSDPTRHDLDTLNAIHAHRRTGQEVYEAQATAFNVNTITKKFYEEYRRRYEHARETIRYYNPSVREFQNSDQSDKLHAFTQRLLGRLMFLYFLQRKGWLGERANFLTDMYLQTMRRHTDEVSGDQESFFYYREVLEPLFFETMNTRRPDNITQWSGIRIPYLNGGLFDNSRDPQGPIVLPDSLFDPLSSEGLLAFFNRYNFTIADDTPLEQDVAVDPEMLGKVFENMLEERDRGQSGSFYTPRAIVSYMCQEALAGYLEESAGISRDITRAQFDPDTDQPYLPEEAERVEAALDTLTVLDPAVGSGSFLVGMMTEIIRLRRICYKVLQGIPEIPPSVVADWKEAIIRDTLYGVDIKPEAIEIAQLRLWLALVVDQTLDQARPLPNLDYKLMAGNSLIETIDGQPVLTEGALQILNTAAQPQQPGLFASLDGSEARKLNDLHAEYFTASPSKRAQLGVDIKHQERRIIQAGLDDMLANLRTKIAGLEQKSRNAGGKWGDRDARDYATLMEKQLHRENLKRDLWNDEAALPFFLYRMHFSEVFQRNGGFDIVVANPPYVRQELISDQKPELQATYPAVYAGTADLYVYFFARGFDLLKLGGQLVYITPNKFMRANYGKKLREFLAKKVCLNTLIDFGDLPIFDATTYPMILIASKQPPSEQPFRALEAKDLSLLDRLHQAVSEIAYPLTRASLNADGWSLSSPAISRVMDKLRAAGKPLGKYVGGKFYRGVTTGLNEAFIINEETRQELVESDPRSADIIKPYLRGRDIKRWRVDPAGLYMIYIAWDFQPEQHPAVFDHLRQFEDKLAARPEVKEGRFPWFAMSRYAAEYVTEFEKPKIISARFMVSPLFGFDGGNHYTNDACYLFPGDHYVLAFLNSSAGWFFLTHVATMMQNRYYQIHVQYLEQIPIPNAPAELHERIAALAQRCLVDAKDAPEKLSLLEADLNALVYRAYGLDDDDIAVIEGHLAGRGAVADYISDSEIEDDDE